MSRESNEALLTKVVAYGPAEAWSQSSEPDELKIGVPEALAQYGYVAICSGHIALSGELGEKAQVL
jgi:hypothetical protein